MPWIKELKIATGIIGERRVPVRWNVETLRGLYITGEWIRLSRFR